jgi:hypothetical protein
VAKPAEAFFPFQQHEKQKKKKKRSNIDQPMCHHFSLRLQPRLKPTVTTGTPPAATFSFLQRQHRSQGHRRATNEAISAGKLVSTVNSKQGRPP